MGRDLLTDDLYQKNCFLKDDEGVFKSCLIQTVFRPSLQLNFCFIVIYFSAVQLFIKKTMVFPVYYHKCYILSVTWNQMLSAGLYRLLLLSTKKVKLNTFCWGISKVGTSNIGELGNKDNSNSYIHTLMVVTAMQGADQHIRSSLRFSILPKDTWSCRPWESNQQPSNNKMLKNSCPLDSWCITVVGGLLAVV